MTNPRKADSRPMPSSRIPRFRSVAEAAGFWDSHDSAEFEDEFEDGDAVKFVRPRMTKGITLRLDEETFSALAKEAHAKGLGPSTLVRMWILERLRAG